MFGIFLICFVVFFRKVVKEIERLGFNFFDVVGNMKSMLEVVVEMEKGMKGMMKE